MDFNEHPHFNSELNIVYRYLRKLGISHHDSEDIVQETAYRYMLYYDSVNPSKIRSWLIRVALNLYLDQQRKKRNHGFVLSDVLISHEKEETPEEIYLKKERNITLINCLLKLNPHYQELLFLKYSIGLSYQEISNLLDVRLHSVKTNLYRARKKLAKLYKEGKYD